MGFYILDVTPLQITPITPPVKDTYAKVFQVARTDTVSKVVARLPAEFSVIGVKCYSSVASNAGTTAIVTVNISDNTGVISTGTADVKTGGTIELNMSNLPNIHGLPLQGDLTISAVYSETGTASTTGGPWKFLLNVVS